MNGTECRDVGCSCQRCTVQRWPLPACVGRGGSPAKFSLSPSEGFVSWRDPKSGSWYIETLDNIFEQWAHSEDLHSLLLRVSVARRTGEAAGEGQCVLHQAGW